METNLEFTPAERLKIYKEILKRLKSCGKDYESITFYLATIILKCYGPFMLENVLYSIKTQEKYFPEIDFYVDINWADTGLTKEGNLQRIAIIEKAIKEVEVIAKPFWSRFFSKLAFWK